MSTCKNWQNERIVTWLEDAKSNVTGHKEHAYRKAIKEIKKWPHAITNYDEAIDVPCIGNGIAKLIVQKLKSHIHDTIQPSQQLGNIEMKENSNQPNHQRQKPKPKRKPTSTSKSKRPYKPKYRSGGWAMLKYMYEESLNNNNKIFRKSEIKQGAQKYCDSSFSKSDNNNYYNAWSSMSQLEKHEYVIRDRTGGGQNKFILTESGRQMAEIMFGGQNKSDANKVPDKLPLIPIKGEYYELMLVYDTREETRQNQADDEKKLMEKFEAYGNLMAECRMLPIGDFIWILKSNDKEYVYPTMLERKRIDDLSKSINQGRYKNQKWRMKKLINFKCIYLIEGRIDKDIKKKINQALVGTEIRDNFLIYHTKSQTESINVLIGWTKIIQKKIMNELRQNEYNYRYDFFKAEHCMEYESFVSNDNKKNYNTHSTLFGQQLLSIPGVTDLIASKITETYPTPRHLFIAWDQCQQEKDKKKLLHNKIKVYSDEFLTESESGNNELDQDQINVLNSIKWPMVEITPALSEKIWRFWTQI